MKLKALLLLSIALPQCAFAADWVEVETRHFIVYSNDDAKEIEQFVERLESYDKLMRMATSIPDDNPVKVRIYQVATDAEVEKALGEHNSGIAGFYSNNSLGPFAVTPRKTVNSYAYFTPELVLHHEYAHHFMLQYFPAIYPSWYVEGFAELIGSSLVMKDGRIGYGMPARQRGNELAAYWVPLQELLVKEEVKNLDVYGQGWALTHFFTMDPARAKLFRVYLSALQNGKSMAEAATVFGDLAKLNREARSYVGGGTFNYKPVKVEIDRPVIIRSRPLTLGEIEAVPVTIAYSDSNLQSIKKESARLREQCLRQENLERARRLAAKYSNDPAVLRLLIEIEFSTGNFAEAERAADTLLASQPTDVLALARKSILMSMNLGKLTGVARDETAAKARLLAVKANRNNPLHPLPLLAFYQSYRLAGQKVPDIAVTGLRQVVSLIPGNSTTRLLLVDELAAQRNYREAVAWLMPLANSPHESPMREEARARLQQLQQLAAGQSPPAKTVNELPPATGSSPPKG